MPTGVSPFRASLRHATLALACVLGMSASLAEPVIRTGGTGSAMPVIAALGAAFKQTHPEADIVILPGLGSSGAIKALGAGAVDLALSARPLKPDERSAGFQEQVAARTPLVFAGTGTYPGLTLARVADIHAGTQQAWPDGSMLRLILRPENDGETALLRAASPTLDRAVRQALARPGMHIALTDQDAAHAIGIIPGAFGLTTLAMVAAAKPPIHAFALDGISPSLDTLNHGRYRLYKPLYLVAAANAAEPVRTFVSFIQSPQGGNILIRHGYQPLAATANRH